MSLSDNAAESFSPSPIINTRRPCSFSFLIYSNFVTGVILVYTSSNVISFKILLVLTSLSPVNKTTFFPLFLSSASTEFASFLSGISIQNIEINFPLYPKNSKLYCSCFSAIIRSWSTVTRIFSSFIN